MRKRASNRGDGGFYFLLGRAEDSSADGSRRLNRGSTGVEIDRRQEGVDKGAEASPAWPLGVTALHLFYINAGVSPCVELFGRTLGSSKRLSTCERSDGL